jgi:hypothetical protein
MLQGFFEVENRLSRYVSVGGGVRYASQRQGTLGVLSGGFAFGQITVHAPQTRF